MVSDNVNIRADFETMKKLLKKFIPKTISTESEGNKSFFFSTFYHFAETFSALLYLFQLTFLAIIGATFSFVFEIK